MLADYETHRVEGLSHSRGVAGYSSARALQPLHWVQTDLHGRSKWVGTLSSGGRKVQSRKGSAQSAPGEPPHHAPSFWEDGCLEELERHPDSEC